MRNVFAEVFAFIIKLFGMAKKTVSATEDVIDVAKGTTTSWKVETMKELEKELDGVDIKEVNKFYNSLYED